MTPATRVGCDPGNGVESQKAAARIPHIDFAVSGRGFVRFITQMYVAGEPRNDCDPVLMEVCDPATRAWLISALHAGRPEPGHDFALDPYT